MKNNLSLLLLCVALVAPLPALAQTDDAGSSYGALSYTYVDGRFVMFEPDGGDTLDGLRIGGSVLFQPNLYALGGITSVSDGPVDLTLLDVGIGLRHPLSSSTDLVAMGAIVLAEVDAGPNDNDDSGISLTGGVRTLISPQFELGGYANYADYFGDGDVSLIGEALLHVTPNLSLAASLSVSDDADVITLGGRWNFDARRTTTRSTLQ